MNLHFRSWLLTTLASILLLTGSSYFFIDNETSQSRMIQLSDLSDADIDRILAVKAEMSAAQQSI